MNTADLASPPDLTTRPDLAMPPDLATAPDLAPARDLAPAVDASASVEPVKFQGGGLACATSGGRGPGTPWALLLLVPALICSRRRSSRRSRRGQRGGGAAGLLCAGALGLLAAAPAHAQSVDATHFRPTGSAGGVLNVEGSAAHPHLGVSANTYFSYASQPLLLVNPLTNLQGSLAPAGVQSQTLMNIGFVLGLGGFMNVGVDVPVMLWQELGDMEAQRRLRGYGVPASPMNPSGPGGTGIGSTADLPHDPQAAGIGDLRISLKFRLVDNTRKGFGLAIMPLVTVPTGDGNSYLGWDETTVEGRLILDYRFASGVLLAFNASYFSHAETSFLNLRLSHELRYGGGVYWPLGERLALMAEIFGRLGLVGEGGETAVTAENSPAEGLVGVRYRHEGGVTLQLGAGLGLGRGYGAPSSRVFAGIGFTPPMGPKLASAGGIVGAEAPPVVTAPATQGPPPVVTQGPPTGMSPGAPPAVAQRGADRDGDRVEDELDRCPDQAGPMENVGCPDRDEDGDGIVDRLDRCPTVVGTQAGQGCPLDGAQAPATQAPAAPSPAAQAPAAQAPTAQSPAAQAPAAQAPTEGEGVILRGWRFVFEEPIAFVPAKAQFVGRSEAQLQAVARLLQSRPDIQRVLIEGHVDEPNNTAERAKALSRERAEAVKKKLIEYGVGGTRLETQGFGYSRLLDRSETPEARVRNNRIEIIIVDAPPATR